MSRTILLFAPCLLLVVVRFVSGDDNVVQLIEATESRFSGSLLKLQANQSLSSSNRAFRFIEAVVGDTTKEKVFTISGEGDLTMHRGNAFLKSGSLRIHGSMAGFEPEAESSYAVVDIQAPKFTTNNFHFIKAAISPEDDPLFEVLGNGTLKVGGDIIVTTQSSNEHSAVAQINTPKITVGKGGAVFQGYVELAAGSAMKIGNGGSFEIEKGLSSISNEDSTTLKISRSNRIQQMVHHATVLIEQNALPGKSDIESPHIEAFLDDNSVFKVGPRGETEMSGGLVVNTHLLERRYIQNLQKGLTSDLLELTGPYTPTPFNFINAQKKGSGIDQDPIQMFAVDSEGSVHANGSIYTNNNLSVLGNFFLHGRFQLIPTKIQGGPLMVIEDISTKSLLEITDDAISRGSNRIIVRGTPEEGQLLLVMNSDSDTLTGFGEIELQPQSLTLLVFLLPQGWMFFGSSAQYSENDKKVEKIAKESSSWFENLVGKRTGANDGEEKVEYNQQRFDGESSNQQLLKVEGLDASEFTGDSIDFKGASVINAALVNPTFDNLKHLTVESIGIMSLTSQSGSRGGSDRLVSVDNRGMLTSVAHVRWEESSKELKVSAISSFGLTDMEVRSNVDFTNHRIRNFVVEPGTMLENVVIKGGTVEDSTFRNVSAEGLRLGDVEMESATLKDLSQHALKGALLTVGIGGKVTVSDAFHQANSLLSVEKDVRLHGSLDMCNNSMINVRIESGTIEGGSMAIHAQSVSTSALTLLSDAAADSISSAINPSINGRLVMIDDNGLLRRSGINLFESDGIGDVQVLGVLDFRKNTSSPDNHKGGSIRNAEIHGGSIHEVEALGVAGKSSFGGEVDVVGNFFVNGAVTVSGTVFGGGPYVDVSDKRLKKDIQQFDSDGSVVHKLQMIEAVTYALANDEQVPDSFLTDRVNHYAAGKGDSDKGIMEERDIGFIAQEVEKIFPMLVYTDPKDGLKGVKYSRFVPVLVAAVNELSREIFTLKESYTKVVQDNILLAKRLSELIDDQ